MMQKTVLCIEQPKKQEALFSSFGVNVLYKKEASEIPPEVCAIYKHFPPDTPVEKEIPGLKEAKLPLVLAFEEKVNPLKIRQYASLGTILVLNIQSTSSFSEIQKLASAYVAVGFKSVLIYGNTFPHEIFHQDYWTDGKESFWIAAKAFSGLEQKGASLFPKAIAASLALGYSLKDALVLGKMAVSQRARLGTNQRFPAEEIDLPFIATIPLSIEPKKFAACDLGLYPIVDSSLWVERLLPLGLSCIQLRIKESKKLAAEIKKSIALAKKSQTILFINDHWEEAIRYGAKGVHLGQEDLAAADIEQIHRAGLYLGLSTHCHFEVAKAHRFRPSYLACGPVFHTESKVINYAPEGLKALRYWCSTLSYPMVAIGGIHQKNIQAVLDTGVKGIAVISAIAKAPDPLSSAQLLLDLIHAGNGPCAAQ